VLPDDETRLAAAMRHATLSGGKRIRAFLAIESAALFRVPPTQGLRAAAAVECDPCLQPRPRRSALHGRRRRCAGASRRCHVKWDEATAVLAGDALQTLAFEVLSRAAESGSIRGCRCVSSSGWRRRRGRTGMAGGQALDIQAETTAAPLGLGEIADLQALKTGALIGWAAESGAILGRSDPAPLQRYAADLGLAFQIRDDILDVEGAAEDLGKGVGKDEGKGKATCVSLLGLEGARQKARDLVSTACDTLAPYGSAAERLRQLARFAVERTG
jgi:farnesyl diphosphate synthase